MRWRCFGWAVGMVLLAGCTTTVTNEQRDAAFQQQVKNVAVLWRPLTAAETAASGGGLLQTRASASNQDSVRKIVANLEAGLKTEMPKKFREREICPTQLAGADAFLMMMPAKSSTKCSSLGCVTILDVKVALLAKGSTKEVWSATFSTGGGSALSQQTEVSESFYGSVAEKLAGAKLLRGGLCDIPATDDLL